MDHMRTTYAHQNQSALRFRHPGDGDTRAGQKLGPEPTNLPVKARQIHQETGPPRTRIFPLHSVQTSSRGAQSHRGRRDVVFIRITLRWRPGQRQISHPLQASRSLAQRRFLSLRFAIWLWR